MAKRYEMTWVPKDRRWRKVWKGKVYTVSCRMLGVPETKEASARAANEWWERQREVIDQPEGDAVARAHRIRNLVRDFSALDDEARHEAVDALLGTGSYTGLKAQADSMLGAMDSPKPERTVAGQIEGWKNLLHSACQSRQMSEGRYDAYCRNIRIFTEWIGAQTAIDAIDEAKVEGFHGYLSGLVGSGRYSRTYAHTILMTAKQFIARLAELRLIAVPANLRSRRFSFNHSTAAKIETFAIDELRWLLAACDAHSERTKLFMLLMLNCGMYQNDISELRHDEVDWDRGTLKRARSKTRERGGPVVTYKLWPETFALLKAHRAKGDAVLATENGTPLTKYWLEGRTYKRYDAIQASWNRLGMKMGAKPRLSLKHLRKTSATLLGQHPQYKYYGTYFLADSPKSMTEKHYVKPSDDEFFEALDWLRVQILPKS